MDYKTLRNCFKAVFSRRKYFAFYDFSLNSFFSIFYLNH